MSTSSNLGAGAARVGAGVRVFLVHRAPFRALRRTRAQSGSHDGGSRRAHVANPPGVGHLDPPAPPAGSARRGLGDGRRGLRRSAGVRGRPGERAEDLEVYGIPRDERRERFEEALQIVKLAWTNESFSHRGRFWEIPEASALPRPIQWPHPRSGRLQHRPRRWNGPAAKASTS